MTPDELRELAKSMQWDEECVSDDVLAAADAWEADLKLAGDCLEASEAKLREAKAANKSLRKRLEAAERWALSNSVECARCGHLAVAHGALGCVRCDAKPECRLSEHAVRILGLRAALAGEEKP